MYFLADLFLLVFFPVIPGGLRTCRSTKRRLNCFSLYPSNPFVMHSKYSQAIWDFSEFFFSN